MSRKATSRSAAQKPLPGMEGTINNEVKDLEREIRGLESAHRGTIKLYEEAVKALRAQKGEYCFCPRGDAKGFHATACDMGRAVLAKAAEKLKFKKEKL